MHREGSADLPAEPLATPAARDRRPHSAGRRQQDGRSRSLKRRQQQRGRRRVLKWASIGLSLLVLATAGAGWLYYQHLNNNLNKDKLNLGDDQLDKAAPNSKGQTPLNILLLGSDSRADKKNQKLGGGRDLADRAPLADVQMLLHVSADRSNASVISVPRDTRVTIPKCTAPDTGAIYPETTALTINASLGRGGPGCTVAAWEKLTGIPIDHFMMIDFSGVVSMADAVGGVPVCVDANIHDPDSGLKLTEGDSTIKGKQALQWLRTRHGFEDGSDIGRTHAQHQYLNSMVRELKKGTKLTNPGKLMDLADAATKALTVDDGLGSVSKLYDLGKVLRGVPTDRLTMVTMPWADDPLDPGIHVIPKPGEAEQVFSMVRADTPLDGKGKKDGKGTSPTAEATKTPSGTAQPDGQIELDVVNATGDATHYAVSGRARAITQYLWELGFTRATTNITSDSQSTTTVNYPDSGSQADALAVAKALHVPASAVRASTTVSKVTLIIGADWRTGSSYPTTTSTGGDGKLPDSAAAINAAEDSECMHVNSGYTW